MIQSSCIVFDTSRSNLQELHHLNRCIHCCDGAILIFDKQVLLHLVVYFLLLLGELDNNILVLARGNVNALVTLKSNCRLQNLVNDLSSIWFGEPDVRSNLLLHRGLEFREVSRQVWVRRIYHLCLAKCFGRSVGRRGAGQTPHSCSLISDTLHGLATVCRMLLERCEFIDDNQIEFLFDQFIFHDNDTIVVDNHEVSRSMYHG